MKMEQIECSETSAYNNQTQGKYPKEYIQDANVFLEDTTKEQEKHGLLYWLYSSQLA